MKNAKRLVSLLLAVVMTVGAIPLTYASDVTIDDSVQVETSEAVIDTSPTIETGGIEAVDPSDITPEMVETVLESSGVSASTEAIEDALTEAQSTEVTEVDVTEAATTVPAETESEATVPSETAAETITEVLETTEPAVVEANSDVTSTEAYILANMNPEYVGAGDTLLAFDMLNVKHTMADRNLMAQYNIPMTINGLWSDADGDGVADHGDAFIMQQSSYMMLYVTSSESEYAVAYVDTMNSDATKVADTLFGVNNYDGELLDGYIYDKETGLVYVPVEYLQTLDEDGNVVLGYTQIQMLYVVNTTRVDNVFDTTTTVNVEVSSNRVRGDVAETGTADISIIDDGISLQIAENDRALDSITEDSIASVQVNGYEADYEYDEETGVLTIDANASTTDTVSVELENPGLLESAGSAIVNLFTIPASAANPGVKTDFDDVDAQNGVYGATWEFNEIPELGDTIVLTNNSVKYRHENAVHYTPTTGMYESAYGKLMVNGGHCEENMANAIIHDGYTTTGATLEDKWTFYPGTSTFYRQYMIYIPTGTYTDPESGLTWTITAGPSTGEEDAGMSGFVGSLDCIHIGVSADLSNYKADKDAYTNGTLGSDEWTNNTTTDVRMTICQVSINPNGMGGYIMVGFLIPTHNGQAGCAFYKIPWSMSHEFGQIRIYKQNPNGYPRGGAYYTAENLDTGDVYTIGPTSDNGYATVHHVELGRYEIRETVAPIGCSRDTRVYTGTVSEDRLPLRLTFTNDEPDITLKKITTVGRLDGWQLNLWCTGDDGRNGGAQLRSDSAGNFYMMNGTTLWNLPSTPSIQTEPILDDSGDKIYKVFGLGDGNYKVREFGRDDISEEWSLKEVRIRCYDAAGNLLGDTNNDGVSILVSGSAITTETRKKIVSTGSGDDIVYSESNETVTDYVFTFDSDGLFAQSARIEWEIVNEGDTRPLEIIKTTNTGDNLSGWQFEVYSDAACQNKVGGPYTTGADGKITADLAPGTYYVKEVGHTDNNVWSSQYLIKDTTVRSVTIAAGGSGSVTFTNNFGGKISVPKNTNTGDRLAGWKFTVYSNSNCTTRAKYINGTTVEVLETDATGWDTTTGVLAPGTYYVKETGGPYTGTNNAGWWHNATNVYTVTVSANTTTKIPTNTFVNSVYGTLSLDKKTNVSGAYLEGWEFTVYTDSACHNVAQMIADVNYPTRTQNAVLTTDENGHAVSYYLAPGTYYVKETGGDYYGNAKWDCDDSVNTVTVVAMQNTPVTYSTDYSYYYNKTYGQISLYKVTNIDKHLDGWQFTVYTDSACRNVAKMRTVASNPATEKDAVLTTNADGYAVSDYLEPGTYYVKETGSTKGYFGHAYWDSDDSVKTVTVTAMNTVPIGYDYQNVAYGLISLDKVTNTNQDLSGWEFTVYTDSACNNIAKMRTDVSNPNTEQNAVLKTDANGHAVSYYLEAGKTYYVKETGGSNFSDDYWVVDAQIQPVTVAEMTTTPLRYDFENTHYARIDLVKTMATDGPLDGWKFEIYEDAACTKRAKMLLDTDKPNEQVDAGMTTDTNGYAISGYLLPGKTYYVKEVIDEARGLYYCKTDNPVVVAIGLDDAGTDIRIGFTNALRPIEIEVLKVDPANKPLATVVFKLEWYDDATGTWKPVQYSSAEDVAKGYTNAAGLNANGELVTNSNGLVVFTNLYPLVDYRLTETATVDGMMLLKDSVIIEQDDVPMTSVTDGDPYTRHYELTVTNYPVYSLTEAGVSDMSLYLFAGLGGFVATAIAAFVVYELIRKKKHI